MVLEKQNYGLIGKNINYSFSKEYFKQKFFDLNLKNSHRYENLDLEELKGFQKLINQNNIKGLNVTIPYKEEVMGFLDEIDENAKKIGAVNTIKVDSNFKLKGYNTDYIGFINSIPKKLLKNIQTGIVLGSGGASKAIIFALNKMGIEPVVVSRTKKKNFITYKELDRNILSKSQIVINCTPLGTYPNINESPNIPYKYLNKSHLCYDLIYNPKESQFIKKSKTNNAKTINGLNMLKIQADESWKIWNS
tara:strand:- start:23530 stop:24276 length:747 start_codon:yes stop_codon:yes gene_type:complete